MLVLVMGVAGAGKTTVGRRLAARLRLPFYDADDFHGAESRAKMARDEPLDDEDRRPWLERLAREGCEWERGGGAVLACSALKRAYREILLQSGASFQVVHLALDREQAARRLAGRRGRHAILDGYQRVLDGQYRDLETPDGALQVSALLSPSEIVERVCRHFVHAGFVPAGKVHFAEGGPDRELAPSEIESLLAGLVASWGSLGRVLLVPPDATRRHSGAGALCAFLYERLSARSHVRVLPALGTHAPLDARTAADMFPGIPADHFLVHDFRQGVRDIGEVPASFVREVSGGRLDYSIRCALSRELVDGGWDRIVSIGQLVPHEVAGIAGHDKNVFIGAGGKDAIDRTHFLGAVHGIERTLGRLHTPVRDVLSYMARALGPELPLTHVLGVRGRNLDGALVTRGLYAGDDEACFHAGAPLARICNVELLEAPVDKVVVYLDPAEYRSTWLGNKAVYRSRLALADGAELLVIAPGVERFGEDPALDRLIRRHGYRGTASTLAAVERDAELASSLAAAAHLIHGSSEGRFRIRYAAGGLDEAALQGVGYESAPLAESLARYDPARLRLGAQQLPDGESIFFIANPGLGLWATRATFDAVDAR